MWWSMEKLSYFFFRSIYLKRTWKPTILFYSKYIMILWKTWRARVFDYNINSAVESIQQAAAALVDFNIYFFTKNKVSWKFFSHCNVSENIPIIHVLPLLQ